MSEQKTNLLDEANLRIQQELDIKSKRSEIIGRILPYIGFIFIFLFFLVVTGGKLLSENNLANLINQSFTLVIVAIGAAFVYAHGGSDFSVGATCGCAQMVAGLLLTKTSTPLWVCLLICILVAVVGACMTSGISLVFGVAVFIGSMCIRYAFNGILTTVTQDGEIFISHAQYGFMNNTALKALILVIFIGIGYYLFEYTSLGKSLRAIGGNPRTAHQAGVKIKRTILVAYIILGVCVGVAAIFQMFRNGKVTPQSGSGIEFNMMMAIVLGGFPMRGGEKGKISSAVIGALTVAVLANGLTLWGVDAMLMNGIKGVLFVVIVALSYDRSMGKLVS